MDSAGFWLPRNTLSSLIYWRAGKRQLNFTVSRPCESRSSEAEMRREPPRLLCVRKDRYFQGALVRRCCGTSELTGCPFSALGCGCLYPKDQSRCNSSGSFARSPRLQGSVCVSPQSPGIAQRTRLARLAHTALFHSHCIKRLSPATRGCFCFQPAMPSAL